VDNLRSALIKLTGVEFIPVAYIWKSWYIEESYSKQQFWTKLQ